MDQVTPLVPQKVETVWYDDGNLIIIAGFKVFRVYQGVLTKSSAIFKDMLSIPQPDASSSLDQVDQRVIDALGIDCTGSAVVRLTDKPQEVEWFLSAFFHDSIRSVHFSTNRSALVGILRLATKYEVNFLRKWTVDCLEKLHPPMIFRIEGDKLLNPPWRLGAKGSECIDGIFPLIDVAVTVGVPWLVPNAFGHLREADLESILYHPEWDEFPDERKKIFLLTRAADEKKERFLYQSVQDLHDDHDTTTPEGRECVLSGRETCSIMYKRHVSLTEDPAVWNDHTLPWECSECKNRYNDMRLIVAAAQLYDLQSLTEVPTLVEILELREKFHKEVAPGE